MKAAVVKGKGSIGVEEVPDPELRPKTLLLKNKYCSICGSDLEYLSGAFNDFTGSYMDGYEIVAGAILGHEFSTEVVEVGEGVTGWSVGDRAALGGVRRPCGQCYFCQRGLYNLCRGASVSLRALPRDIMPYGKT